MHILALLLDVVLAGYVTWEVIQFVPRYRRLKQEIARGDTGARIRIYQNALAFEWISALLALAALGFNWSLLKPASLDLDNMELMQSISRGGAFVNGLLGGVLAGVIAGTLGMLVARIRANRRGASGVPNKAKPAWRKLLPDFSALLPVTMHERLLWAAVAISAGVCEEIVFRGWLLATLHGKVGLAGTGLILVAAIVFGLAHAYQGISGILLTAFAGAFFCILYVATGSLLIPILLHSLIDLRFALMPAPVEKPSASYA
jgi:membrane protease YdiL (CAAX protease family)